MNGVKFGGKHSISDWDLLMVSKDISEAEPKIEYIEIPARNGSLDITEAISGEVMYKDRNIKFNFDMFQPPNEWWNLRREISNYLNGKKVKIILDQDPNYYFFGRCIVDNFSNEQTVAHIDISAICEPWRYKLTPTTVTIANTSQNTITNDRKTVVPMIHSTVQTTVMINGISATINAGFTGQIPNLYLKMGENTVSKTGSGMLTLTFQEGSL